MALSVSFKVKDKDGNKLVCYGWVVGGDGKVYGVCSDGKSPFKLVKSTDLSPDNTTIKG